jgi:hypothetical protein
VGMHPDGMHMLNRNAIFYRARHPDGMRNIQNALLPIKLTGDKYGRSESGQIPRLRFAPLGMTATRGGEKVRAGRLRCPARTTPFANNAVIPTKLARNERARGGICRQMQRPTINAPQKKRLNICPAAIPFRPARLPFCWKRHKVCRRTFPFSQSKLIGGARHALPVRLERPQGAPIHNS